MSLNFPSSPAPVNGDEYYYSPTNTTYIFEDGIWLVKSSNVVSGGGGATIQDALSPASSTKGASVDAVNTGLGLKVDDSQLVQTLATPSTTAIPSVNAVNGILQNSIVDGVIDKAPTVNAVFDAIAAASIGGGSNWTIFSEHTVAGIETEIEFLAIPSDIRVIKILFKGLSKNSVNNCFAELFLGTASSYNVTNADYIGECLRHGFTSTKWDDNVLFGAVFADCGGATDDIMYGEVELIRIASLHKWILKGSIFNPVGGGAINVSTGMINLSAALTRIKLAFQGGGEFDGGSVAIMYQS